MVNGSNSNSNARCKIWGNIYVGVEIIQVSVFVLDAVIVITGVGSDELCAYRFSRFSVKFFAKSRFTKYT